MGVLERSLMGVFERRLTGVLERRLIGDFERRLGGVLERCRTDCGVLDLCVRFRGDRERFLDRDRLLDLDLSLSFDLDRSLRLERDLCRERELFRFGEPPGLYWSYPFMLMSASLLWLRFRVLSRSLPYERSRSRLSLLSRSSCPRRDSAERDLSQRPPFRRRSHDLERARLSRSLSLCLSTDRSLVPRRDLDRDRA